MGERDSLPLLHGDMEMDEGFFPNETIEEQIQLCLAEFCYKFNPTIFLCESVISLRWPL